MKITDIEFVPVRYPLKAPFYPAWFPNVTLTTWGATVVKVHTDEGVVGYGSQSSIGTEVKTVGESQIVRNLLVGADVFNVEKVIRILSGITYSMDTLRLWGIEVALWDIIGKTCGKPIYKLLGGGQDRVLAYASTGMVKTPKEHADDAVRYLEMGFKAIKIRLHREDPKDDLAVVKAVRDAIQSNMYIMVDANQACPFSGPIWSYQRALKMARELEKLDVYWLEEPLHHEAHRDLARLAAEVNILIAGGEDESGLHRFRDILDHDCFDVIQPDTHLSGGILQLRKIAAIAESMNKLFVPHTWDTGINLAAGLQLIGSVPNCPFVEYCIDLPAFHQGRDPLLKQPIELSKDGYVNIPDGPGLGVEIDEAAISKYRVA
jgi:L-alanine-DL-glutamate epimerase-like enolase superfamily enzyme